MEPESPGRAGLSAVRSAVRVTLLAAWLATGMAQAAEVEVSPEAAGVLSQLLEQVQRLQVEIQAMRGDLELQAHTIEGLRKRQRELYMDMDRRVHSLESGGRAPVSTTQATAPTETGTAVAAAASTPAAAVDPQAEEAAYQAAFNLLRKGKYDEASAALTDFVADYPNGKYAPNAQYWLGEAYYVTRAFEPAREAFQTVLDQYAMSPKVPDAMLKVGYIHYEQEQWNEARAVLDSLRTTYPTSAAARLAAKRLERMRQEGH